MGQVHVVDADVESATGRSMLVDLNVDRVMCATRVAFSAIYCMLCG